MKKQKQKVYKRNRQEQIFQLSLKNPHYIFERFKNFSAPDLDYEAREKHLAKDLGI